MVKTTDFKVELYFDHKPPQNYINGLKECGWKWNSSKFCWYNQKSEENLMLAKEIDERFTSETSSQLKAPTPSIAINMNDIIVRTNSFFCNVNHTVMDIKGHLTVIDKYGNNKEKLVSLALCLNCATYYILEETYAELKKHGVICGRIMTKKDYVEHKDLNTEYWRDKSPLKLWGYSVSKADALSVEQRWTILERVVDSGIMTLDRELSYLDFFIKMSSNPDSIESWRQDRKHMQNYTSSYSGHVLLI